LKDVHAADLGERELLLTGKIVAIVLLVERQSIVGKYAVKRLPMMVALVRPLRCRPMGLALRWLQLGVTTRLEQMAGPSKCSSGMEIHGPNSAMTRMELRLVIVLVKPLPCRPMGDVLQWVHLCMAKKPGQSKCLGGNGSRWSQVLGTALLGSVIRGRFGDALALSSDRTRLAVRAASSGDNENGTVAGSVQVFDWNGSTWSQLGNDLTGAVNYDGFGGAIALSSNGSRLAVGADWHIDIGRVQATDLEDTTCT